MNFNIILIVCFFISVSSLACGVGDKYSITFQDSDVKDEKIIILSTEKGPLKKIKDNNGYASFYIGLTNIFKNNKGKFDFSSDSKTTNFLIRNVEQSKKYYAALLEKFEPKLPEDKAKLPEVKQRVEKAHDLILRQLRNKGEQDLNLMSRLASEIEGQLGELDINIEYSYWRAQSGNWAKTDMYRMELPKPSNEVMRGGCNASISGFNFVLLPADSAGGTGSVNRAN